MIIIDTAFLSTNQNQRFMCDKRFEFIQKMNKQVYLYTDIKLWSCNFYFADVRRNSN